MDCNKEGIFSYKGLSILSCKIIKVEGTIHGKHININLSLNEKENYINIDLANQSLFPELSIIKKKNTICNAI